MHSITIVGAGVTGLTTAAVLRERGVLARVIARELPADTTSAAAGAIWYPSAPHSREHATATLREFLARDLPGVRPIRARKFFRRRMGPPWWRAHVPDFRLLMQHQVPAGYRCGYEFTTVAVDMPIYLAHLARDLAITRAEVSLDEVEGLVVNCAVPDASVRFTRGETMLVDRQTAEVFLDDRDAYVVPRADRGTIIANHGIAAPVLARYVGYRPMREGGVRMEREGKIIHHYGHGGAGVTLSWGSARAAVALITELP